MVGAPQSQLLHALGELGSRLPGVGHCAPIVRVVTKIETAGRVWRKGCRVEHRIRHWGP